MGSVGALTARSLDTNDPRPMSVFHVRPVPQGGGWQINRNEEPSAILRFPFRYQAIEQARQLRTEEDGEVRVYGADGRYSYTDTVAPA